MSQALDELVNGPSQPPLPPEPTNPIPSAPPNIANQQSDVFNPLSLTIDIPSASAIPIVDVSGSNVSLSDVSTASEVLSDTDSDESYDESSVVMPATTAERIGNPIGRRIAAHTLTQMISHAIEEEERSEPGRSNSSVEQETRECSICYNKFGIDKIVNTDCGHKFCSECFFRWMKGNVTCALCRNNFTSWRRHSNDTMNRDIMAVTEMFNSTLREHVHLNKLNNNLQKDMSQYRTEKAQLMDSLIRTRKLIDYNRGYAEGLLAIHRPKHTGNENYDEGLMKGYEEFRDTVRKDRQSKRASFNFPKSKNKKKTPVFRFFGSD